MKELKTKVFNSLNEQKEFIKEYIKKGKHVVSMIKRHEKNQKDFYGKNSLEETLKGFDYGFQGNTEYFLENLSDTSNGEYTDNCIRMDIEGCAYDMGAVIAGEPECCINMQTRGIGKRIEINIDLSFHCGFTAEEINNRGIAIVRLINTLLAKGYIVDLYVYCYNNQDDMDVYYKTKISTETLTISTVAFISSVEFFRKIDWITTEVLRGKPSEDGLGCSRYSSSEVQNKITKSGLCIPGGYQGCNHDNVRSVEAATKWVQKLYEDYCKQESEVAA